MSTTTTDEITPTLLRVLHQHLRLPEENSSITLDSELEKLGLDSMSAVVLLLTLEKTFNITFPDSMLTPDVFRTGASLRSAIQSLVGNNSLAG